jgi:hypothetical protein
MGKTPPAKNPSGQAGRPAPPAPDKSRGPFVIAAAVVVVVGIGVFFWRGSANSPAASPEASAAAQAAPGQAQAPPRLPRDISLEKSKGPEAEEAAKAQAALGPHKQRTLPPIPFNGSTPPRPPEVVAAAYQFAAEHPEVLAYVPCFCGCENGGHRGNEDCFVKRRDPKGDVVEWEEHGLECLVCIDVATRSRQMFASGASVADIRAAVDKEFGAKYTTNRTPTPIPHSHSH